MGLALSDDHHILSSVARSVMEERYPTIARESLDVHDGGLPPYWKEAVDLGWLGLHIPESLGGQGFGIPELSLILEALGRACAPGPFLPTVTVSAILCSVASDELQSQFIPGLADGSVTAGLGLWGALVLSDSGTLEGFTGPILGTTSSQLFVLAAGNDVVIVQGDGGLLLEESISLDVTRSTCTGRATSLKVLQVMRGARSTALNLFSTLAAAEAAGGAAACVDMASSYAKERVAFGRPIGQFQAVKHHCANMAVASEMATAAAWDAARAAGSAEESLAAAVAVSVTFEAFFTSAKLTIQVLGGIGYTWEHDAHLYLRRAMALLSLTGPASDARRQITETVATGTRRTLAVELPAEADQIRVEVRSFIENLRSLPKVDQHKALVDNGYLFPHWPRPWGRGAGAVEQIVIDEEFAGIDRAAGPLTTAWILPIVLPTILAHGSDEQKERWIRPSLEGTLLWCQLFSEPDAGSDLGSLRTAATKVEGGWLVSGSKVWTTSAQYATLGFALVRTDSDAPKHRGITCMAIDMHAPGLDIRPLREITGSEAFNQEFLDEVFVPDQNVIGEVNQGWSVARTTLGNERVSLGVGRGERLIAQSVIAQLQREGHGAELGALLAEAQTLSVINLRQATSAVIGGDPGAGGNVTKLVNAELSQRAADLVFRAQGPKASLGGDAAEGVIASRLLTIAGGTSEIIRNTIAEHILGLPRDPRP
jgi:alkylation response protein AidB-like acyl-CoA dehydrogenase